MDHWLESTMMGTRAISGSAAIRFKNSVMAAWPSSMPSSMLISMIWAPFSTCCRATSRAVGKSFSRMSRAKRAEPVTLVRSPTLTNNDSLLIAKGSSPERRSAGSISGICRGSSSDTAPTIARMWSGVVPQQPPTMFTNPLSANSWTISAIISGV